MVLQRRLISNLPILLLIVLLFVYIVYPLGAMLSESLSLPVSAYRAKAMGWDPDKQPFAAPLRRVFSEPNAMSALSGTLKIALSTVIAGGAWGLGLALLWSRREFPGRRFFAAFGYAPVLMPPLVGTLAFYRLIGDGGMLWHWIPLNGGRPWLGGFGQVLLMHVYSFGIYTYAYTAAALEDTDFSREDAARSLGAGALKTFFAAVWPLVLPAVLASALLTFMGAAASFSAPYILDNPSHYLTVEIVNNRDDLGLQRALGALLACVSLAALPGFLYFSRQGRRGSAGAAEIGADVTMGLKGAAARRLPQASPAGAALRIVLSLAALAVLLAPPAMVVFSALFSPAPGQASTGIAGIRAALNEENLGALQRSGLYGAAAAGIDVVLALAIALALRRASFAPAMLIEFAVMLAVAIPGSVVALSILSAFNGPTPLAFGVPLGGTAAILIYAYALRCLPLAVRPARAALEAVGGDLENAAASLGAGRARIFWRVVLPLILPSLLAAALICFITGMGEFVASELLYYPWTKPVSVQIAELFRTAPAPAFVLALCLMILSAAAVAGRFLAIDFGNRIARWMTHISMRRPP